MKTCPTCDKQFPDAMRFCQTCGTPLVDVPVAPPEDFLKTTVVRQEDLSDLLPVADPYKTVVGAPLSPEDSGDLLQLPEEFDPMQTMVATPIVPSTPDPEPPAPAPFEELKQNIQAQTPVEPPPIVGLPIAEPPVVVPESPVGLPEPPSFLSSEPAPPSFGSVSPPVAEPEPESDEDIAATMIQNAWEPPVIAEPVSTPSPFDPPSSPFAAPASPFDPPAAPASPFEAAPAAPETPAFNPPSFQEPPPVQFGQQFDQMNQGFGNQPLQTTDWNPPAPPESGWQDQGLGANTPFQPPVAGVGGEDRTLAIVSLVTGILGLVCCGALTGIVALITGYMAKNNCDSDPARYGGRGMAVAGMILGAISIVLTILVVGFQIFVGVLGNL